MSPPSLWDRLKKARIVRILLVYGGASWVVLQITETLTELLALPEWVGPVAVVLLLVGLVVVLATAWVQSLPRTTAREEAGEVPTDWQVAPGDVMASLRQGRLPHLTWGRAILGGVFALALLFGAAGLYVMARGPNALMGPAEAGAEGPSSGIAVLPFHVTGPSLDLYREGMVDLVSANLDGLSGFRAVDSRTVLARWSREVGEAGDAELTDALRVAAGTGARYAVVGNGVELGSRIRFTADIYDLDTREKVGDGQVEGSADEVLGLVDALTVDVMRSLLDATGQGSAAQTFRLASVLTESVEALRHYLEGDAAFRRGHFEEARNHLERAIQQDSTFALAHWRLGEAIGWIDGIGDPESQEHKARAAELRDRLPPREATLLAVSSAVAEGRIQAQDELANLEEYLRRYPDDPDGWYLLSEIGIHRPVPGGPSDQRLEEALYEAVELDPTFGPFYYHALEWASAKGQRERFDSLMAGWLRTNPEEHRVERMRLRDELILGDGATRAAAVEELRELDVQELQRLGQFLVDAADRYLDRVEALPAERLRRGEATPWQALLPLYWEQGRIREARALLEDESGPQARVEEGRLVIHLLRDLGGTDSAEARAALEALESLEPAGSGSPGHSVIRMELAAILNDRSAFDGARADLRAAIGSDLASGNLPFDTVGFRASLEEITEATWLAERGRAEEAYRRVAATAHGESVFSDVLADLAYRTGRWREAVRIYEGISRGVPGRSLAKYRLGRAYEELGDTARAADAYRTFLARYESADPGLEPVEEARSALERLGA